MLSLSKHPIDRGTPLLRTKGFLDSARNDALYHDVMLSLSKHPIDKGTPSVPEDSSTFYPKKNHFVIFGDPMSLGMTGRIEARG